MHFLIWLKHPVHLSWGVTQDTRVRYNGLFRKWTRYDIAFYLSGLSHFYARRVDARNGDLSVQSNLVHTDPFGPNTSVSTVPFIGRRSQLKWVYLAWTLTKCLLMGYVNVYFFLDKPIQRNVLLNVGALFNFDAPWSKQQEVSLHANYISTRRSFLVPLMKRTYTVPNLSFLVSHLYFIILTNVNFRVL